MAQTVIRINCKDQTLKVIDAPVVSSGGIGEDKVIFDFCPLWDGFTKTAVFSLNDGEPYQAIIDADNSCVIPAEALVDPGTLHIGVYGLNADGVKRTTAILDYKIDVGAVEGVLPAEPSPGVYDQLLKEISNIKLPSEIVKKVNGKTGNVEITPEDIGAQPVGNYLIGETDPTVPLWAKQPTKPSYTAKEIGAEESGSVNAHNISEDAHYDIRQRIDELQTQIDSEPPLPDFSNTYAPKVHTHPISEIPSLTENLEIISNSVSDVKGDISDVRESVASLSSTYETKADSVSKYNEAKTYTDGGVAHAITYTDTLIAAHNTTTDAHNDIRLLIDGLTSRLNALADSDDTTLDQMSEVVAYIKENKELIESITTNKVSVTDIVDNLVTNVDKKPLSAAQGVVLKGLIDALQTAVNGKAEATHQHSASDITSGTLPLSLGGTGRALSRTSNALIRFSSGSDYFSTTATKNGALYATSSNGSPTFGTLPIAQGGTGATDSATALTNLGAAATTHSHSMSDITSLADNFEILSNSVLEAKSDIKDFREEIVPHTSNKANPHGVTAAQTGALPLAGGLMNGSVKFQSSSLPQKALQYICGIDAFADGGEMGWQSKGEFLAGYLTTANAGTDGILPARLKSYQDHTIALSDPNSATATGFYYINGGTNRPPFSQSSNIDYRVLTTAYSDQWLQQIATDFRCTDVFVRRRENGNWTSWLKLAYSSEISGLSDSVETACNNALSAKSDVKDMRESLATYETKTDATSKYNEAIAYTNSGVMAANGYTDNKIAALINSAPTTLDTLGEIATAMQNNADVVTALNTAVGTKANASDFVAHAQSKTNPHNVTASQVGALSTQGGTLSGTLVAPVYKSDTTHAAIKPSDSNEVNFGSNADYIYFGYENRIGSAGAVSTYNFGTHSGAGGARNGKIVCGEVIEDGASLTDKYAYKSHSHSASDITSGGTLTGPLTYSTNSGNAITTNYISAGGGYSPNSGKYGVKLVCCDQPDCQTGMGQDLTGLPNGYELSIAGGRNAAGNVGYISFAMHSVNSTEYDRLGYFDNGGNFYTKSQIYEGGTALSSKYMLQSDFSTLSNSVLTIKSDIKDLKEELAALKQSLTITFTISGTSYSAMRGMTWGEWVNSTYNTAGAKIHTDSRILIGALVATDYGMGYQCDTDVIAAGKAYVISA